MLAKLVRRTGIGASADLAPGQEQPAADEGRIAQAMIDAIKAITAPEPGSRTRRFNQSKTTACLDAEFDVPANLPGRLHQGLFASPGKYRAVLRFANASRDDDRKADFRGLSIKVYGVTGSTIWGDDGTQDFLLNSYPALFAATPAQFLEFIESTRLGRRWLFFVKPRNWRALLIVLKGRARIASPLDIPYYSTTPYRFGPDETVAVKYAVRPCSTLATGGAVRPGPDFLTGAVSSHLSREDATFEFAVQFQSDPGTMPIEDASTVWDEQRSPLHTVAHITIPRRSADGSAATRECEAMTFNPWQCLEAHRPLGGINRVRRAVYAELGKYRQGAAGRRRQAELDSEQGDRR